MLEMMDEHFVLLFWFLGGVSNVYYVSLHLSDYYMHSLFCVYYKLQRTTLLIFVNAFGSHCDIE